MKKLIQLILTMPITWLTIAIIATIAIAGIIVKVPKRNQDIKLSFITGGRDLASDRELTNSYGIAIYIRVN